MHHDMIAQTTTRPFITVNLYYATQIPAVCKGLRSACASSKFHFQPRLLVVSSEANLLVETSPVSGKVTHTVPIRKPARRASTGQQWWPTVITFCPYNGDFYVCQYAVRQSACTCGYPLQDLAACRNPGCCYMHAG